MSPQRRTRFKTQPKDQRASDAPVTLETLELLQRYRYLPTTYIGPLIGRSYDYLKKKVIPRLFHEGYVFTPIEATQSYRAMNRPRVIAITDKGEAHLKDYGRCKSIKRNKQAFRHKFMGELARASFEIASKEIPYLTLLTGQDILNSPRCPRATREDLEPFAIPVNGTTLRPDDELMGYRYAPLGSKPRFLFFLREDDRDTEPLETRNVLRSSLAKHFEGYLELEQQGIYRIRYGVPNCLFLFLTISEERVRSMMRLLLKITDGKGSPQFCFKTVADFASYDRFPPATGHMARIPWQRAGFPAFNILVELGVV